MGRSIWALSVVAAMAGLSNAQYPESWNVIYGPSTAVPSNYSFGQETTILKQNTTYPPATMPLPCDIVMDRDVPITLRDGTVIYTDVYRPASQLTGLPAIVNLSPYGKTTPTAPQTNVLPDWFTRYGKSEAADAGVFACRGFAVINPDNRGAYKSEGNIQYWGSTNGEDGYDVVEWSSNQTWSSGKVATYGASWLAVSQWFVAALHPPHLTAIVPWSGMSDYYRDSIVQGGIPDVVFATASVESLTGEHETERVDLMATTYPLMNEYWQDKVAKLEEITVPAYVVADGTFGLHAFGALEGFRKISSQEKWLRLDGTQEWYDMYDPANEREVLQFLDHYLKNIDNGWELTPKVRAVILDPGLGSLPRQGTYSDWPVPSTVYQKYYLDAGTNSLSEQQISNTSSVSYNATSGSANFTVTFNEDTQLIGYTSVRLYVEADGNNDMDLFLTAHKIDANGTVIDPLPACIPEAEAICISTNGVIPAGPAGRLRVSLRELNETLTTPFMPVQKFTTPQNLTAGEIVAVDIAFIPKAHFYHAGQSLQLSITGYNVEYTLPTINKGSHIIHTGGDYQSYLQVPVVPL